MIDIYFILNFYNKEFIAKNIISLELYFRDNTTLKSSIVIITADTMIIADSTIGIVNDNCIEYKRLI